MKLKNNSLNALAVALLSIGIGSVANAEDLKDLGKQFKSKTLELRGYVEAGSTPPSDGDGKAVVSFFGGGNHVADEFRRYFYGGVEGFKDGYWLSESEGYGRSVTFTIPKGFYFSGNKYTYKGEYSIGGLNGWLPLCDNKIFKYDYLREERAKISSRKPLHGKYVIFYYAGECGGNHLDPIARLWLNGQLQFEKRFPRGGLRGSIYTYVADLSGQTLSAEIQHDEDCTIGVFVYTEREVDISTLEGVQSYIEVRDRVGRSCDAITW